MALFELNIYTVLFWVFAAWHYALRCGYISDDHAVIAHRKDIIPDGEKSPGQEKYWIKVFNDGVVMYFINAIMFRLNAEKTPAVWHALSLAIHLANVYLLNIFLQPLIGTEASLIACILWGINPMLNQSVVWVSGRPYSIALFLTLIGMIFWNHPVVFMPLYLFAVITNISIALVPIILKMIFPEAWQTTLYLVLMIAGGIPFILWKFHRRFTGALVIDRDNFRFKKRRFNTIAKTYAYYLWSLISPTKMGWYHESGFKYNAKWNKFNFFTLSGYAICYALAQCGFAGWWFLLGILPNANIFATNSFLQDRYVYFGSIGFFIIVAPFLVPYHDLLLVLCAFYLTRSYMYSRQMVDDEKMYRENWRNHPKSDYAVNNLSFFLIQRKRFEEARVIIQEGLNINNRNKMLWYNLGVTWASTATINDNEGKLRFLRAMECWKMALKIEPRWTKPAEDLQKLTEFLVQAKIITRDPAQAASKKVAIETPVKNQQNK